MKLNRAERLYWHKPFWGNGGVTPEVQVGDSSAWFTMTLVTGYTPPSTWAPPTGYNAEDASWYQTLLAGPDATGNPVGTIVVTTTSRIRTKVTAGDEVDIQPDDADEWIFLVT